MRSLSQKISSSWIIYSLLLVLRFVACNLPGYIHPDEFFQSGQELWFGCPSYIPWEFESQNALRSVFPPWFMTWMPLQVYAWIVTMMTTATEKTTIAPFTDVLSGHDILIIPRITCALLSIVMVDASVWMLSKQKNHQLTTTTTNTIQQNNEDVPTAVLLLASAWPCYTMLNRPFTNSMETMILSVLMAVCCRYCCQSAQRCNSNEKNNNTSSKSGYVVGILCALGFFTRFTFVCYAVPVVLVYIWKSIKTIEEQKHSNTNRERIQTLVCVTVPLMVSFVLTAMGLIYADNVFYGTGFKATTTERLKQHWTSLQMTPLNAFLYNSKTDNLRDHGLHPRWTHALVNMHILYGPMAILCYWTILFQQNKRKTKGNPHIDHSLQETKNDEQSTASANTKKDSVIVPTTCQWIIICGLSLLSSAPHQEPRFLLPLLVPMVILSEDKMKKYRSLRIGWLVFNVVLFVLFGILHQGGVVPSLLARTAQDQIDGISPQSSISSTNSSPPEAVLYYHTYMPPTFLSRQRRRTDTTCDESNSETRRSAEDIAYSVSTCPTYPILDLKGDSNPRSLCNSLDYYLSCSIGSSTDRRVYLVSPPLHLQTPLQTKDGVEDDGEDAITLSSACSFGGYFECRQLFSHYAHLTTEDFPPFRGSFVELLTDFNLSVYEISCRNI